MPPVSIGVPRVSWAASLLSWGVAASWGGWTWEPPEEAPVGLTGGVTGGYKGRSIGPFGGAIPANLGHLPRSPCSATTQW